MSDKDWMDFDEAIALVMERTGKNRRQARRALFAQMRDGKLPAHGYDLETGEDIGLIPPEAFPQEH